MAIVNADYVAPFMLEVLRKILSADVKESDILLFSDSFDIVSLPHHFSVYVLDEFSNGPDGNDAWILHFKRIRKHDPHAQVILYSVFPEHEEVVQHYDLLTYFPTTGTYEDLCDLIRKLLVQNF